MNNPNVIVPVFDQQNLDEKYDQVFSYLNDRNAVIHFVSVSKRMAFIHSDSEVLRNQQSQILKMSQYLKYETLDRLALKVQERYPDLTFEYHVQNDSVFSAVKQIMQKIAVDLLVLEANALNKFTEQRDELSSLVLKSGLPVWTVSEGKFEAGTIVSALDIPTNNSIADRFNRILVVTASGIAADQGAEVMLMHGWMSVHEQFLKKWLRLNDIDIARISRADKQQRLAYLQEYAIETGLSGNSVSCKVCATESAETLVELCNQLRPQLVVAGIAQNAAFSIGSTAKEFIARGNADVLLVPESQHVSSLFAPVKTVQFIERNKEA